MGWGWGDWGGCTGRGKGIKREGRRARRGAGKDPGRNYICLLISSRPKGGQRGLGDIEGASQPHGGRQGSEVPSSPPQVKIRN